MLSWLLLSALPADTCGAAALCEPGAVAGPPAAAGGCCYVMEGAVLECEALRRCRASCGLMQRGAAWLA